VRDRIGSGLGHRAGAFDVDVISIGIYIYKEVYLTAGLYVIFLILAVTGLLAWRRADSLPASS